jgi:hypothetical protein
MFNHKKRRKTAPTLMYVSFLKFSLIYVSYSDSNSNIGAGAASMCIEHDLYNFRQKFEIFFGNLNSVAGAT